jgi:PHP family Zn ribbon phosphoesterase
VPLREIVAEALGMTVVTKRVEQEYNNLLEKAGSELEILIDSSRKDIEAVSLPEIAEGIIRVREGKVFIEPGYDGVYGTVKIFSQQEPKTLIKQTTLF